MIEAALEAQARFKRTGIVYSHRDAIRYACELAAGKKARKPRGRTGYVALYEYQPSWDRVIVRAIRHQREAGFED